MLPAMTSMQSVATGPPVDTAIVGFSSSVHVFSSKQLPKKLTIYADDFRWCCSAAQQRSCHKCHFFWIDHASALQHELCSVMVFRSQCNCAVRDHISYQAWLPGSCSEAMEAACMCTGSTTGS